MASWSDNIEAVARAITAKRLAHDGISEEQLAADVDMWWHACAAELKCGVIDETGDYVGGKLHRERALAGYRDWMDRHPASRAVWEPGLAQDFLASLALEAPGIALRLRVGAAVLESRRLARGVFRAVGGVALH